MPTLNERFLDYQVAQQIRWVRLSAKEAAAIRARLSRVDDEIRRTLMLYDTENASRARLVALRKQLGEMIADLHAREIAPAVHSLVQRVGQQSLEAERATFQRFLPAGLDVTTPNPGALMSAIRRPYRGATLTEWLDDLRRGDVTRAWRTVNDGITSGRTNSQISRDVIGSRPLRYKDGIRSVTRRGTEMLVRTAVNHATNQGRQLFWEENTNLISGIRWVSTLDTRTSPICRDLDGQVFPVDDGPRPPAHPNCRSTTVAVTKSWEELGINMRDLPPETRASMNGQVPARLTYREWLARQDAATMREAMGARAYRDYQQTGRLPEVFGG